MKPMSSCLPGIGSVIPTISLAQAASLDRLSTRYTPLLAANREKARLRREVQLEETRRRIFG